MGSKTVHLFTLEEEMSNQSMCRKKINKVTSMNNRSTEELNEFSMDSFKKYNHN